MAASTLPMRTKHLYVNSDDVRDNGLTYVIPKNLLRQFISVSDLRTQVAVFMFGKSPPDSPQVKEIRAFVLVPQVGTHQAVTLPNRLPDEILTAGPREANRLEGLEPLGWLHTQVRDVGADQCAPTDVTMQANFLNEHKSWHADSAVVATCSFTPGSCSLSAWRVTAQGFQWGKSNKDALNPNPSGYKKEFAEKVQLLLSDIFLGFFLVPEGAVWNYSYLGINIKCKYIKFKNIIIKISIKITNFCQVFIDLCVFYIIYIDISLGVFKAFFKHSFF